MEQFLTFMKKREEGLTLAEVLATIVIMSILFTTVLLILVQTAKTHKTSEEIIDATYVAQTEMEEIYAASKNTNLNAIGWFDSQAGYTDEGEDNEWHIYTRTEGDFFIEVRIKEGELTRIVIVVKESSEDTKPQAQMEHHLLWKESE